MWWYQGKIFTQDQIDKEVGFVYIIKNLTNNRFYIGKKLLTKAGYKQVKGKKRKIRKISDWESYYGSNKELQEDVKQLGESNFKREILHLCYSRSECSFLETYEIIIQNALLSTNYYNDWLMVKVRKDHLKNLILKQDTATYKEKQ